MNVHANLQKIDGARVIDTGVRTDAQRASIGYVLEAPYLDNGVPLIPELVTPTGWLRRIRHWLGHRRPASSTPRGTQLSFRLPFTEQGQDALGLFDEPVPFIETESSPRDGIRRVRGAAVPLLGDRLELFDDFWAPELGWRVAQGSDFAVVTDEGAAIIISCGKAPLIVSRPSRMPAETHHDSWSEPLRALHRNPSLDASGWSVSIREGDVVEVLGVVRPLRESQRSFQLDGEGGPYRRAPTRPTQVLGDEDGTRLVMRVIQPRAG